MTCASDVHYHGTAEPADVKIIDGPMLCAECAVAFLTWQLDGCPDPAEHEQFEAWASVAEQVRR